MFGKFTKKKSDEKPEVKSKQKNDLFTLLEQNSTTKSDQKYAVESKPLIESSAPLKKQPVKSDDPKSREPPKTTSESKSVTTKQQSTYIPESSVKGDKSQLLLLEIEKIPDKTIKPVVDFNESSLFYPILATIGEDLSNSSFLDDLVTEGVLVRKVYEKLIICPLHPDTFSSSVRLYCPKCDSLNVDKLNLYEHKRCGFITENTSFDFSKPENSTCPGCKKKITDFKKEIRIPAMWHQCLDCNEKFDNAIIKLYCRKHEHDFDTNSGQFITTYSYRLKDYEAPITSDDEKMHQDLEKLLGEFNFSIEFKAQIKGKSGNPHKIPIYAKNKSSGETIAIFVSRQSENLTQVDVNAILIPILDVGPKHTLLLTTAGVDDLVKPTARQYGIEIISDPDLSKIVNHVDAFVSEKYSRNGEK